MLSLQEERYNQSGIIDRRSLGGRRSSKAGKWWWSWWSWWSWWFWWSLWSCWNKIVMLFYSLHMRGRIGSQLRSTTALHIGNSQSKLSLSSAPPWPLSYSSTRSSPLFSWEAIQILFSDWIVHHTQNWQTIVMALAYVVVKSTDSWLVGQTDWFSKHKSYRG